MIFAEKIITLRKRNGWSPAAGFCSASPYSGMIRVTDRNSGGST